MIDVPFEFDRAEWVQHRACTDKPVAFFFPPPKQSPTVYQAIRDVCAGCPVQAECLDYSLRDAETRGWWGGLSEAQRTTLRTGRPRAKRPYKERARAPIEHGTVAGQRAHLRRKVAMCDECRDAWNAHKRMKRAEARDVRPAA